MIKDIIRCDNKKYQVSTVNLDGCFETMIFPIEDDMVVGKEVYMWRTSDANESQDKHRDILNRPEKYISEESIAEYLRLKEELLWEEGFGDEDDEDVELPPFPAQYLTKFFLGEMDYDEAVNCTVNEICKHIDEAIRKRLKT